MVLVTGATGFLGKFIVEELLSAGYELRLLTHKTLQPSKGSVEIIHGDVMDISTLQKAMNGVSMVVHAAAVVSFWKKRREEMMRVNVAGTANVVNACMQAGVKKLIHVSSIGALGGTSNYAISKYKAEQEVNKGIAAGLNAVIINPGTIIGPADDWNSGSAKIFSIVSKGLKFYNRGITGFVGAKDVARAVRLLLEIEVPSGEQYVLVSENLSQRQVCSYIAEQMGKDPPRIEIPARLTLLAGHIFELFANFSRKETFMTLETFRYSVLQKFFDGSKIKSLGFNYTPMKEVFAKTTQAFLDKNNIR